MPIRLSLPKSKREWRYLVPEGEVAKYTRAGFHVAPNKRHGKYAVTKRKPEWEKFEDEVRLAMNHIAGRRLTYSELTGKETDSTHQ